eukprot:13735987-Alexandrium_andersonii.AAC.1
MTLRHSLGLRSSRALEDWRRSVRMVRFVTRFDRCSVIVSPNTFSGRGLFPVVRVFCPWLPAQ